MSTNEGNGAQPDPVARRPVGARFHAPADETDHAVPTTPARFADRSARPSFDRERRGYDRRQVDRYAEEMIMERARLLAELEDLRRAHDVLLLRLDRAAAAPPRAANVAPTGEIADKLLRTARREALMIRADAQRAAQSMLDAARSDVDRERRSP